MKNKRKSKKISVLNKEQLEALHLYAIEYPMDELAKELGYAKITLIQCCTGYRNIPPIKAKTHFEDFGGRHDLMRPDLFG